jgi:hypothetical protein
VQLTGAITAGGNLDIYAGVNPASSLSQLENAAPTRSELSGADVVISGAAALQASGRLQVTTGGNVTVQSSASAAGLTTRSRPRVSIVPQTVYVVTGYTQVATGTILVPECELFPAQ